MESPLHEIAPDGLEVIETFGFTPKGGFERLALHIDRCETTCRTLGFPFDRGVVLQSIGEAVADEPARVRMTVDATGQVKVVVYELAEAPRLWRVGVSEDRLRSDDPWLTVKTTQRALYDRVRGELPEGVDEMIFLNEHEEVCEGTITNLFVKQGDTYTTPPLSAGVLPGCLRQELLDSGQAREENLHISDLTGGFFLGNSLRGLITAELLNSP